MDDSPPPGVVEVDVDVFDAEIGLTVVVVGLVIVVEGEVDVAPVVVVVVAEVVREVVAGVDFVVDVRVVEVGSTIADVDVELTKKSIKNDIMPTTDGLYI